LQYISDADARPTGSAHANAHLWDNGTDVSDELENVLEIRQKAIENFSTDNIKSNEPYSVLEDVFVPLYFFHRYQAEAVAKVIGGLNYNYAVKNGNQKIVERVSGNQERKALKTILKTIDINEIAIPREKLALFPPRAIGFGRSRESFKSDVGVAFDAFGAVETASEMTFELLLHPQRVSRLIAHKSLEDSQLGLPELLDEIINNTIKKSYKDSYFQELQNVVNIQFIEELMYLSTNENQYKQINAIVDYKLNEIAEFLYSNKSTEIQKIYNTSLLSLIKNFKKNPKDFKKTNAPKIPDGSPIGTSSF